MHTAEQENEQDSEGIHTYPTYCRLAVLISELFPIQHRVLHISPAVPFPNVPLGKDVSARSVLFWWISLKKYVFNYIAGGKSLIALGSEISGIYS